MEIIVTIKGVNETEFLEGILKKIPIPSDTEYTAKEWLDIWTRTVLVKLYKQGRKEIILGIAEDDIEYNVDVTTSSV